MTVTATHRFNKAGVEVVFTHDDARALIANAVPGATVKFARPRLRAWNQRNTPADATYAIALPRLGSTPIVRVGSYSLPAPMQALADDARNVVESAIRAAF